MEEILTQVVEKYVNCNEFSKDDLDNDLKLFTDHIGKVFRVNLATIGKGSVVIILECPTLDSLEHLWSEYLAGHLDNVAERYLVTNELKKKLNLETIFFKSTIEEEDYLNCKEALMELRSTYSGEFKQSKVMYLQIFELGQMYNLQAVHGRKCNNNDYNNYHHYHNDADNGDNNIDWNFVYL